MWNHIAFASKQKWWDVTVIDNDEQALTRMKNLIYPWRYWEWDNSINLSQDIWIWYWESDIISICTPPNTRIELAKKLIKENPKLLHLEKPLCDPTLKGLDEFIDSLNRYDSKVVVWYNHVVSNSIQKVIELLKNNICWEIYSIKSNFKENWSWIFKAHPWLSWPSESYLWYSNKWWWASWEHSHALHLWLTIANFCNIWNINNINFELNKIINNELNYDNICNIEILTNKWKIWNIMQDVISIPTEKKLTINWEKWSIEWVYDTTNNNEYINLCIDWKKDQLAYKKTRQDDFLMEIEHFNNILNWDIKIEDSALWLDNAIKTMKILSYIHWFSSDINKII